MAATTKTMQQATTKPAPPKLPTTYKTRASRTLATLKRAAGSATRLQRSKGPRGSDAQTTAYRNAVRAYVDQITTSLEPATSTVIESTIPDA